MTELRQCKEYGEYLKQIEWVVEKHNGVQAFVRKIPLTPLAVMKIQRASIKDLDFGWIKEISRKHKVISNYIELLENIRKPTTWIPDKSITCLYRNDEVMRKQGYRPVKNGMLPTKTQTLDLRDSTDDLRKNFKAKTRYNLGLAQRKGLTVAVKSGTEMKKDNETFLKIIRENANRVGYWAVPDKWVEAKFTTFKDKCFVVFVKDQAQTLAVALFLTTDTTCFYSMNGSTAKGRMQFAPTLAIWAAIEEAQKRGLQELDFDGVYDERLPNKRWLGYTRFKAGFGGEYVYYPPAYLKWLPGR